MDDPLWKFLQRFRLLHTEQHDDPLHVNEDEAECNGMRTFLYPPNVLRQLRAAWNEPGWHEPDPEPLPADSVLRQILEVAYHASFTAEERRATRLSLVFCDPSTGGGALVCQHPRPFSVDEVRRLAPAGDIQVDPIGIHTDQSNQLKIWGLASDRSWRHPTFAVLSPGAIELRRFDRAVFALVAGSVTTSSAIDHYFINMIFEGLAHELVDDFVKSRGPMGNAYDPYQYYGTVLFDLLREATGHGHGATIFVIPDAEAASDELHRFFRIKYSCSAMPIWPALRESARELVRDLSLPLDGHTEDEDQRPETDEIRVLRRALSEWPGRLARLSRVDGGVLITDRYQLLGFGVEVVVSAEDLFTIRVAGALDETIEQYGTRHRSAFRLCSRYPNAVAFVCSQDGGIKCVRNLKGIVTIWK